MIQKKLRTCRLYLILKSKNYLICFKEKPVFKQYYFSACLFNRHVKDFIPNTGSVESNEENEFDSKKRGE
jgi:hypothetical protein